MEVVEFVTLVNHPNYEMLSVYPHTIRKKANHKHIKETPEYGYLVLMLQDEDGRHKCLKHRLVAEQFIPNPDNLPEVDHQNHNRSDNHISNLRWCTRSENDRNKASYGGKKCEYIPEIDKEAIHVTVYGEHEFEDYYFFDDTFYFWNGVNYRKLPVVETPDGYKAVNMITKERKKIKVFYTKFKRMYDA